MPVWGLLALALAGFITILTETPPAGLLPRIGATLDVAQPAAGQLATVYAIGSLVSAIPLTVATQRWRRRRILLTGVTSCCWSRRCCSS
jgi:predicted MFS family arabinose efflux permease